MPPSRNEEPNEVDVLVIGGGIVGAAAALAAARQGVHVAMVERSPLGTAMGSSKGTARIYAPAPYPDDSYLGMGLQALERWREIEVEAGEQLMWPTGVLSIGEFAERALPALISAGVDAELISADQAGRRFGVCPPEDRPVLHQPDAGVVRADRALAAVLRLGREAGVEARADEGVTSIHEHDEWVAVETSRRSWRCSTLIAAAGPWNAALLARAGLELATMVSRQTVAYLELAEPSARPVAVIDYDDDEPYVLLDPERGLMKAALHARGPVVDPDRDALDVDRRAVGRITAWVEERFPGVTTRRAAVEPCLYTNTPDERFILERRNRIVIAAACNGQGFQLAPETGERVAQLALGNVKAAAR